MNNFFLASDIFYYSKRGCTVDPDDGKTMGEQDPADAAVVPSGYTAIKQYNQRSTSALGNTGRSSSVNTAAIFGTSIQCPLIRLSY